MPLAPIRIDNSGNQILRQIIAGQNVTLRDALARGVQGNRDQINNQTNQEAAFLNQRRFDRNFREQQFKDRRDFGRRVFEGDRNFAESSRQFNVRAADADADRALKGELGRGQLGVARAGLQIRREESAQRLKLGSLQIERERGALDRQDETFDEIDNFIERERVANDREAFAELFPELPPEEQEERRQVELGRVTRDAARLGFRDNARFNDNAAQGVAGTLLPQEPRNDSAQFTFEQAQNISEGDPIQALELYAQAASEASPGSPLRARILQARTSFQTQREAAITGTDDSTKNANKAVDLFRKNQQKTFGQGSKVEKEIEAVNASLTRDQYVKSGQTFDSEGLLIGSPSQNDDRAVKRGEFYDLIRGTSPADLDIALSSGDPNRRFLKEL